jgi:uncharacterized protein YjgD (DUF1641 family)
MSKELLEAPMALHDRPEVNRLLDRLNDPTVAASLNSLLDNIELLAVLVAGLDGLARKGEVIGDTIAEVLDQVRATSQSTGLDPLQAAQQLGTIIPTLAAASPAINRILESPIVEPEPIDVLSETALALVAGLKAAESGKIRLGLMGLFRATRDKDVQRGLGFVVEVARVFGRDLDKRSSSPAGSAA